MDLKTEDLNLWQRTDLERLAERARGAFFRLASERAEPGVVNVVVGSPERGSSRPSVDVIDSKNIVALTEGLPRELVEKLSKIVSDAAPKKIAKAYVGGLLDLIRKSQAHGLINVFGGTLRGERYLFSSQQWLVEGDFSAALWSTPLEREDWQEVIATADWSGLYLLGTMADL